MNKPKSLLGKQTAQQVCGVAARGGPAHPQAVLGVYSALLTALRSAEGETAARADALTTSCVGALRRLRKAGFAAQESGEIVRMAVKELQDFAQSQATANQGRRSGARWLENQLAIEGATRMVFKRMAARRCETAIPFLWERL
jgi:hypothetical protein